MNACQSKICIASFAGIYAGIVIASIVGIWFFGEVGSIQDMFQRYALWIVLGGVVTGFCAWLLHRNDDTEKKD